MPFGAVIRPGVIRPLSVKISPISWVAYHKFLQSSSTNIAPPIYVAPSFPDDFESSPLAPYGPTIAKQMPKWDESRATLSEAEIKADRDDVKLNAEPRNKTPTMEEKEPELDEM
ncbi:hypothetical protein N7541_009537 [Penicillium brevicompactum]|uniref:Uncharacterized protein n=1 Tax=Penicillium brevicompactum TaxID=5074 RepID=A0A9W9UGL9_PENBR|nr:hypothetical protein N7541_009537 [Penicillium brevicompactum]